MNSKQRDYLLYLEDIVLSMQQVQEYIIGFDFQHFKWDYKTVDAVIRNFEIIGEATKNIPQSVKDTYPNIPWDEMYRLRNKISQEYFRIDYEIIYDILTRHLPKNYQGFLILLELERKKRV